MRTCEHEGCGWQAIAPSAGAANDQYARHLVESHGETVDADIPEGKVEIRVVGEEEWRTVTLEEAMRFHDDQHEE